MSATIFLKGITGSLLTALLLGSGSLAKGQLLVHQTTITTHSASESKRMGQTTYHLSDSKNTWIRLSGTTPIRNWTMSASGLSGEARMRVIDYEGLSAVQSLVFALPVCNLKGEVKAMDNDAYAALKSERYKEITFELTSATVRPTEQDECAVGATGNLTVAGVTRTVTLHMRSHLAPDGTLTFTGAEKLRMSDYNVERPSLLFGAIRADDVMTLSYTLIFTK